MSTQKMGRGVTLTASADANPTDGVSYIDICMNVYVYIYILLYILFEDNGKKLCTCLSHSPNL